MSDRRLARGRRLFEYHCYEGEDSSDAELWHHTHQPVVVLARVQDAGVIGGGAIRMYRVRFADGYEHDVFDDELVTGADEYERPDYAGLPKPRLPRDGESPPSPYHNRAGGLGATRVRGYALGVQFKGNIEIL